jgi:cell wall-associated NlpC family hydrolase
MSTTKKTDAQRAAEDALKQFHEATRPLDELLRSDEDGDGLTLNQELALGTNPERADTDGDGLSDSVERRYGSSPLLRDTDADGLDDSAERRAGTDARKADSDGDGLRDGSEASKGRDPLRPDTPEPTIWDLPGQILDVAGGLAKKGAERFADWDGDGVSNQDEKLDGTNPNKVDSDGDGLSDGRERRLGTSGRNRDSDGDGIADGNEVERGLDPTKDDSDGDGIGDADEVMRDTPPGLFPQPVVASSTPAPARKPAPAPSTPQIDPDGPSIDAFLRNAIAQEGDRYKFGAEAKASNADPTSFDCSELVEWAAARAGVTIPDGTWRQFQALHKQGGAMDPEDALEIPGALLFTFKSDPLTATSRPAGAHVAISLGNGQILEAASSAGEVVIRSAEGRTFSHAAIIPGFSDAAAPPPSVSETVDRLLDQHGFGAETMTFELNDALISGATFASDVVVGDEVVVTIPQADPAQKTEVTQADELEVTSTVTTDVETIATVDVEVETVATASPAVVVDEAPVYGADEVFADVWSEDSAAATDASGIEPELA